MISSLHSTLNLVTTPLRRHRWVLVGCLLLFVGYGVFSLRNDVPGGMFGSFLGHQYHHGWPWLYMSRVIPSSPPGPGWLGRVNLMDGVYEFQGGALLANFSVALGLSILATCLWWIHCRQGKMWQVSIREILILFVVVSVGAGGFLRARASYESERDYLETLDEVGWTYLPGHGNIPWYVQPLRDVGLVQGRDWQHWEIEWLKVDREIFDDEKLAIDINQFLAAEVDANRRLSARVQTITIADSKLSPDGLGLLPVWAPHCDDLCLYLPDSFPEHGLGQLAADFPRLKYLWINAETITAETIAHLAMLRHLESLQIFTTEEEVSLPANFKRLSELPKLKHLSFPDSWKLSPDEQEAFDRQQIEIDSSYGVYWICDT